MIGHVLLVLSALILVVRITYNYCFRKNEEYINSLLQKIENKTIVLSKEEQYGIGITDGTKYQNILENYGHRYISLGDRYTLIVELYKQYEGEYNEFSTSERFLVYDSKDLCFVPIFKYMNFADMSDFFKKIPTEDEKHGIEMEIFKDKGLEVCHLKRHYHWNYDGGEYIDCSIKVPYKLLKDSRKLLSKIDHELNALGYNKFRCM